MLRIEMHPTHWVIWLDAPHTRNALSIEMVQAMRDTLQHISLHPQLRALVLRGADGHFCSGGDFASFKELMATPAPEVGPDQVAIYNRDFGSLLQILKNCEVMTVALVQGYAVGGGCGLAAACDLVIADDTVVMSTPEVSLGLPPAQIAPFIQQRLGHYKAMQMILSTRKIKVQEALQIGLVDEHVSDIEAALATWQQYWTKAEPAALRATIQILRKGTAKAELGDILDFASLQFANSLRSGTTKEGITARAEKRLPSWALD
jgi:isohexenylglutaconyl-CoA hydratase